MLGMALSACVATPIPRARPAWAGEASTDVDCSVWTARYSASAEPKSWRLRAARRGYLCLEAAGENPRPAWLASLELSLDEPHSLELTERYCSRATADPEDPVLAQAAQRSDLLTAACALGVAERLKGEPQRQALKRAVAADPNGVRGRRAMLALARQASGDSDRRGWLRRAIEPRRGVWSSFGHAEVAGLRGAADELVRVCERLDDRACVRFAKARLEELDR